MWPFNPTDKVSTSNQSTGFNSQPVLETSAGRPSHSGLAEISVDPAGWFSRYGYPIPIHDVAKRSEFVSCYNRQLRVPQWVIEHVTAQSRNSNGGNRQNSHFAEDNAIPTVFRARLADYFRSGYDRGHQAPAADAQFNQRAMDETFYLTNIAPQVGDGFNRDYWAHFERFCRNLTKKYASVRIATGPLFLPQRDPATGKYHVTYEVIGNPPNVAVPTHFFKLVIGEDPLLPSLPRSGAAVAAFVLPNAPISNSTPLQTFEVPVDAVERSLGVEFLPKLAPQARRQLCKEVQCQIEVKEFNNAVKQLPPPPSRPALPGR